MAKASDNLFPYLHLVPAAAPASPAAGAERLFLDSGNGNKLSRKNSSGTVSVIESAGGSAATELLASTGYNPGTQASYTTTTNSETDVDATNLVLPAFTAPSSGKVKVTVEALAQFSQTGASQGNWCLREGTTLIASYYMAGKGSGTFDTGLVRMNCTFYITGLTPGSSHTYKWAWRAFPSGTWNLYAGGPIGAAVMEVWSLI